MKLLVWCLLFLFLLPGGFAEAQDPPTDAQREETEQLKVLEEGAILLKSRRPQEAISRFDKVIAFYGAKYRDSAEQVYCARSTTETLFYLTKHANEKMTNARVVRRVWCDAHFLKAYALVELGRLAEAKTDLEVAVTLSPSNSQYLSELGNVYLRERNWQKAIDVYQAAEEAAQIAEPQLQQSYLARAYRGVGYAFIELDRLDEAEAKYKQSLTIDPNDKLAPSQLEYIRQLRAKRAVK